jgi:hypothetical protein
MITWLILLEISRLDEYKDTKEGYQRWMEWVTQAVQRCQDHLPLGSLQYSLWSLLVPSLVSSDSSCWDFSNDIGGGVIEALMCLQDLVLFFVFFLSLLVICEELRERKKILESHQNFNDDTISTVKKILTKKI